jgi:hypothetical protein
LASGALLIFVLNLASGLVALLTSYYALKFNRLLGSRLLTAISAGFTLLGIGLLADAATSLAYRQTLVGVLTARPLATLETGTYLTLQVAAYAVLAVGYAVAAYGRPRENAIPVAAAGLGLIAVGMYRYAVVSYFFSAILLAFVVFQGVLIHSRTRSRFSLLVLLAFVLVMLAHMLLLAGVLTLGGRVFLLGTGVQFLGFVSLLAFIVRSGRVGKA